MSKGKSGLGSASRDKFGSDAQEKGDLTCSKDLEIKVSPCGTDSKGRFA